MYKKKVECVMRADIYYHKDRRVVAYVMIRINVLSEWFSQMRDGI
jgi:hypothetical protein